MTSTTTLPETIHLAPMEGVADAVLRDVLASIGGIDQCTTEFIRVGNQKLPEKVFRRFYPEIDTNRKTHSGISVIPQLLGDNKEALSRNALKLVDMGATAIDMNFGCPARTVNNHGGGSILLKDPDNIFAIMTYLRRSLPEGVRLTAKMRLGYRDKNLAMENAQAIESAGADGLTVHARTKIEGYKPPAHWQYITGIREKLTIPVIANGEMWTPQDIRECLDITGCRDIMLGRGLIACPELALRAKGIATYPLNWGDICLLLIHYLIKLEDHCHEKYRPSLIKQWLIYLRYQYGEAHLFFESAKRIKTVEEMQNALTHEVKKISHKQPIQGKAGRLDLSNLGQTLLTA